MPDNRLERRAEVLASAIQRRIGVLAEALVPDGERPPFTQQLTKREALAFWRKHRNDAMGKSVLNGMTLDARLELDQALSKVASDEEEQLSILNNGLGGY